MENTAQEWEKVRNEFKDWYYDNNTKFELTKNIYQSLITSLLMDQNDFSNPQIESRIKDRKGCLSKFERKYLKDYKEVSLEIVHNKITDLIGLRIICSYEDEIEKIGKIIEENFNVIEKTDKTKELEEEETFGYKGLHLDVKLSQKREELEEYKKISQFQVEIQIRTIIQHAWSSLDHKMVYKHDSPSSLKRAVKRLAAVFEIADSEFMRLREETKLQEKISEEKIKATEEIDNENLETDRIDFITFNKFLSLKFKYPFYEYRTNQILQEIFRNDANFSLDILSKAYEKEYEKIDNYVKENSAINL